jgi:hypothetical protein
VPIIGPPDGWRYAEGAAVPSAAAGFASGGFYRHADGAGGDKIHFNNGDETTSSFVAIPTS